ncbi:MAG: biotin--[acetyl-CoA-carboxylase] ligase [Jatrophihabitans sp.]
MNDPERAPVPAAAVAERAVGGWRVTTVATVGSTNSDLLAAAATGAPERTVLLAELQTGGRGRLQRSWVSPAGAGLTFSLLVRPTVPVADWGWLPLLTGLALGQTLGPDARLKWPNDLLLGPAGGKVAGILAQAEAGAVVIGVGLNVSTTAAELPVPTATSLALQGYRHRDRTALLTGFLTAFAGLFDSWQAAHGDAEACGLAAGYRASCATLGQLVSAQLPGRSVRGQAVGIDPAGRLLLAPEDRSDRLAIAVGDVTHVRPISR